MTQDYLEKMTRILDELERSSRKRSMAPAAPMGGMAVARGGRRLLNFSGNDYLGLARDPRLAAAAELDARMQRFFLGRGLLLRPLGGTLYLLPPYCITDEQLDLAYAGIAEGLERGFRD